jgi:hypothetical protein
MEQHPESSMILIEESRRTEAVFMMTETEGRRQKISNFSEDINQRNM